MRALLFTWGWSSRPARKPSRRVAGGVEMWRSDLTYTTPTVAIWSLDFTSTLLTTVLSGVTLANENWRKKIEPHNIVGYS